MNEAVQRKKKAVVAPPTERHRSPSSPSHTHNRRPSSTKPFGSNLFLLLLLFPFIAVVAFSIFALWPHLLPLFPFHTSSSDPDPDPDLYPSSSSSSPHSNHVTYGSVVKLMHERTRFRLHSHDIPYGSGSGQQSVTAFGGVEDANSYWIVKEAKDSEILQGNPVLHGATFRLQHLRTHKWLHSHMHSSPITGNLEVSCFGGPEQTDSGDLWILEIEESGKVWTKDQRVRLRHVDTGAYLHSHDRKYSGVATGQQEVCGMERRTADSIWVAAEGIYLPVNDKESS